MAQMIQLTRIVALISLCGSLWSLPSLGVADDVLPLGAIANHNHDPIRVRSKPVIERLPLKVIQPIDLKVSRNGHIFVADCKADCVFRLDEFGSASVVIDQLPNIQRMQVDSDGSVFVLTSTGGESSLHQITLTGQHVVLETFSFPATTFVRDSVGEVIVATRNSGRLVSVSAAGIASELTKFTQPVKDIIFNAGEQLEVLLSSGDVVRVDSNGATKATGYAPPGASRMMALEDGSIVALTGVAGERSQVVYVAKRNMERPEKFEVAAFVPAGTESVGFDLLGNLCLANPDLRAVTKVTSQFLIPCPHCGRATRMIFSTDVDQRAVDKESRSF
jgi:hypothetical protein